MTKISESIRRDLRRKKKDYDLKKEDGKEFIWLKGQWHPLTPELQKKFWEKYPMRF